MHAYYRKTSRAVVAALISALWSSTSLAQTAPLPNATSAAPAPVTPPAPAAPDQDAEKRMKEALSLKYERKFETVLTALGKLETIEIPPGSLERARVAVIAGRWKDVEPFLKTLTVAGRTKVFEAILTELERLPPGGPANGGPNRTPSIVPSDAADLSDLAPGPPTDRHVKMLAAVIKPALAQKLSLDPLIQRFELGTLWFGGTQPTKRERAADFLIELAEYGEALRFLPPLQEGKETASFPLLEKHAKLLFLDGRKEKRTEEIVAGWRLNQMLISAPTAPPEIKERAWRRMADFARWLPEGMVMQAFREYCQHGKEDVFMFLRQVTAQVGDDRWNREPLLRQYNLELQRRTVAALLPFESRPEIVRTALNQFALLWLDEVVYFNRTYTPPQRNNQARWENDAAGNLIQVPGAPPAGNSTQPKFVPVDDLINTAPDDQWRALCDPALQPRLLRLEIEMRLKVDRDEGVLALIEKDAPLEPKEIRRLVSLYLRGWAKTHDPHRAANVQRGGPMAYGVPAPQGLPLTRALQQRNLEELVEVVKRLRALALPSIEVTPLVDAFAAAHSQAEVFQLSTIERVFGSIETIDPDIVAELARRTRERLATQWRKPAVQEQAKTQRNDAEIIAEAEAGYRMLTGLIGRALSRQPDQWRLALAQAAATFDWAEFQYGQKVDLADYTFKRDQAFAAFAHAAGLYQAQLPKIAQEEETPVIYLTWLGANFGAIDVGQITRQRDPSAASLAKVRDAIESLPGGAARRHRNALAATIWDNLQKVPSHLKQAYLKGALNVLGDSPAKRIRAAVAYYEGMTQELELELRVDGDPTVGLAPFGALLALHHTTTIERESGGGFGKYLRNDSQQSSFYGYYGAPPVDRRDMLEKSLRERLGDRFEVISVTFLDDKVQSYGYGRPGWRETPLAYVLLKAKDAAVDRLPSVQLDMDFVDHQGTVILPVASPIQPLDTKAAPAIRPMSNLEVTQILDERNASLGRLSLEVKATCAGVLPKFNELFSFAPGAFKIDEITDSGPAIQRVSSERTSATAFSERTWLIKLSQTATGSAAEMTFRFPRPMPVDTKTTFKRYQDVDLVEVPADLAVAGLPLRQSWQALWTVGGIVVLVGAGWFLMRRRRSTKAETVPSSYQLPSDITPFTTLRLLKMLQNDAKLRLGEPERSELSEVVAQIEAYYFAHRNNGSKAPNLSSITQSWLNRAAMGA